MSVKQTKTGKWLVQVDRRGIPRVRKTFIDRADAEMFEREYLAKHETPGRLSLLTDERTMKELVDLWFKYHGINLADGERRVRALYDLCAAMENPRASSLTAEQFVNYRYTKLQAGLSEKTANNLHGYLSAMFNKLRKLKVIDYENPIGDVDFIKIQERQLSYLSINQINLLLETIKTGCKNKSTWFVAQMCLRTGARWGEVEQLKMKQLHDNRVTYEFTKSKRTRTVPLDEHFYKQLIQFAGYKNPDDRIFSNCIGAFRRSVKRADIDLPKGQNTHILRHSFASHFVMNGGNVLTLQKILGHADIKMTMRYAHLSPDHLGDAVKLNPVAI